MTNTPEERAKQLFKSLCDEGFISKFASDGPGMKALLSKHIAAAVEEAKREERERIAEILKQYTREHFPTGAIRDFAIAGKMIDVAKQEPTP